MRLLTLIILMTSSLAFSQALEGSWKLIEKNGKTITDKEIISIFQDGYMALGAKGIEKNDFLFAYGGEYKISDSRFSLIQDFNTKKPELIGVEQQYEMKIDGDKLELFHTSASLVWQKISSTKDDLTRNWVFTGREKDGEIHTTVPGDRRTVKILSGNRFQWIAFNSETKEFSGTGGGTYELKDGKYIEHITFFSRNNDRVGAELTFEYEIKSGKWHHRGKSSAGNPIYEIWSPYEEAYKKQ